MYTKEIDRISGHAHPCRDVYLIQARLPPWTLKDVLSHPLRKCVTTA
jgi:hypothetical protein